MALPPTPVAGAAPSLPGLGALALSVARLTWTHDGKVVFRELFRSSEFSVGVYALPAGASDPQAPHTEDEIYYILEGFGALRVGETDLPAVPETILYVPATVAHRFHSIRQSIVALVIFAPPEGSRRA